MAGRGRGRGRLSVPGDHPTFGKSETSSYLMQPPPNYPPLEYRPLPTNITNELRYLLQLKKGFADYMHESPNNVLPMVKVKDKEWYSDRYKDQSMKQKYDTRYDWSRMPAELKSQTKRKGDKCNESKKKKRKEVDVDAKLKELENKESTLQSSGEEDEKDVEDEEKEEEDAVEEEAEDSDEEMDEGTDYVNSYFDNGESYVDEEDDNADEATF